MEAPCCISGADAGIAKWRFEELLPQAVARFVKIIAFPVLIKGNGKKVPVCMTKLSSFDLSNTNGFSLNELFIIDDLEEIPLLKVEKVEGPGIYLLKFRGKIDIEVVFLYGLVKGRINNGASKTDEY